MQDYILYLEEMKYGKIILRNTLRYRKTLKTMSRIVIKIVKM
ncbi:hypothetical protein N594_00585 [Streptococcus equi subsp. zooepidemicus Sz16]|nr:hypothetical protein N594_00585 [Streptococcus equi subsp. zooepidemicus Sz16]